MKAAVFRKSKGLVIEDLSMPTPGDDGLIIRVANTGFCGSDHSLITHGLVPEGYILGHETSGIVQELGSKVDGPAQGTRVIIRPASCGACRDCKMGKPYFCQNNRRTIGVGDLPGGFAEYVKVFPDMLIPVPDGVDSRNAALAEAFAAALHGIRCSCQNRGSALVIGGGPIGLALVKLLKVLDFGPVVLSEPVRAKQKLALDFGADKVVDPFSGDLGQLLLEYTEGIGFETVFECSGAAEAVQTAIDSAARGGTLCIVSVIFNSIQINPLHMTFKEIWMTASYSNTREENLQILQWMAQGNLDGRPLITDSISLDQLPEVYHERIETGKAMKVMIQMGEEF
jgi:(R,R)-butanediol dehydrogenase/meso-butanediol dehydrogenase/diacetyl reductase